MSFVYPQFLWGFLALSIPIIVHLFNFRRAKKLYFSNVQFLEDVKQTSSSKLRLKHYLVLLSRLLFIIFLVLTFAQPFIPGKEQGLQNKEVYLYLDNSLSMTNEIGGELSALDQAYAYLSSILDLYPRDTRYKLLTNDFAPFSNSLKGKEEVEELTTEINLSNVSRSMSEVLNRFDPERGRGIAARDLYLISDFQKSSFGALSDFVDSVNNYYILPIEYPVLGNVYVDSVYLKNPFITGDRDNELYVKLINTGDLDANDLVVKFFMEDRQVATASIDLLPESSGVVSFDLSLDISEIERCRLSFEEFPVTFDNDYYFILSRSDRINVMEIRSNDASNAISKVYGNEQLFNFTSMSSDNVEYARVPEADMLILNELPLFNETLLPVFNQYVANGGELFIIPAEDPDSASYQSMIRTPISLTAETDYADLSSVDPKDPFFEGIFESIEERFDMPQARSSMTWRGSVNDLISFRNGDPYLTRFNRTGGMYLLSSPLKDSYTGFHKYALFVPIMYRAAVLSKTSVNRLSYNLQESVLTLKLDSLSKNVIYKLKRNDQEIIPNQRVIGDELILELPRYTLRSGFYELMAGEEILTVLAFNHSKQESLLDQYAEKEEIEGVFAGLTNLDIFEVLDASDFTQAMKERYEGINLWKYALVLALTFLLAEVLLLRFL